MKIFPKLGVEDKLLTTMPNISDPPWLSAQKSPVFQLRPRFTQLANTKYPAFSAYSLENLRLKRLVKWFAKIKPNQVRAAIFSRFSQVDNAENYVMVCHGMSVHTYTHVVINQKI